MDVIDHNINPTESHQVQRLRQELAQANRMLARKTTELERQLQIAAQVHESLLPEPIRHPRIDVDVRYKPIEAVGGDYCQVRFPDTDTCYITMCDVTGHGIGPSLLASRVSSEVRHFILNRLPPSQIVSSLNKFVIEYFGKTGLFLSFIAARIDLEDRTVAYSGAGHPSPLLIRRATGMVQPLISQNLLIGVSENVLDDEPEHSLKLDKGDRLLFYTDGITETADAAGRQVGTSGLARIGSDAMRLDLFDMADGVLDQIERHRYGPSKDDKTLIVAEIK